MSFARNALNDQFDLVRHQLIEKMVNDKTHSGLVKLTYHCLKERDIVLNDRDFLNLQQLLLDLKQEADEIFKAIAKAVYQTDKYKSYTHDISDRHQKRILSGESTSSVSGEIVLSMGSRASSTASIPRVLEFQIGDQVPPGPFAETAGGFSSYAADCEAMSLIDENSTLLHA